jgi:hypothetical protein
MRHVSNSAKVFVHSQRKRKPKKLAKTKLVSGQQHTGTLFEGSERSHS